MFHWLQHISKPHPTKSIIIPSHPGFISVNSYQLSHFPSATRQRVPIAPPIPTPRPSRHQISAAPQRRMHRESAKKASTDLFCIAT